MEIILKQQNDSVHFEAANEDGNTVQIDGAPAIGGENKGMRPMQLLLTSVGACSAFDVVSILKKQREPVEDIQIRATAERPESGDVKPFTAIHLVFEFKGKLNEKKVNRAVSLAVEKYCSVAASLNPDIPLTYEAKILES
ncbi:MAG: OsmC family protein [Cyclonatronaceae bacterium]